MTHKLAVFIPADPNELVLNTGIKPSWQQMQDWVGGYVQATACLYEGRKAQLVVNEDGFVLGLPVNTRAKKFVQDLYPGREVQDFVGNAIILLGWRAY